MTQLKTDAYIRDLFEFLSIPSISAQKKHKKDMLKASRWLEKKLKSLGFQVKILPTAGHPVVYAERLPKPSAHRHTLLLYGHYDVQDPGNLDEWSSEPFKPEIRSGNIYARGAADDKGNFYTWIAALEELSKKSKIPTANIKFLIEGEEEVASKNLEDFITQNKSLLSADICLISDSRCLSETQPAITYGLRGILYTEVHVEAFEKEIHSGLYGGNVTNPTIVLAQIISKLKDEKGKILVPGFYQNVRKLTASEIKKLNKLPFGEKEIIQETGAKKSFGETDYSIPVRAGARPTLDVNGVWGGYQGEGEKTIIPGKATAKISMRLVPNQDPESIKGKFEEYVRDITPDTVGVEIKFLSSGKPTVMDIDNKFFKKADAAYKKVFGKKPIYELSGGSVLATAAIKEILGVDSILMGYGLPDDGIHGPNEKFSLTMFTKGIKTNIDFLKSL
jgi:acetylornithine deacetylase/succinyl-diaminopimelate desuccinylase-like protein